MPDVNDFLKGFGLYKGDSLETFTVIESTGFSRKETPRHYIYLFELIIEGKDSKESLLTLLNQKTTSIRRIKAQVNWYMCSLFPIQEGNIEKLKKGWVVTMKGESFRS